MTAIARDGYYIPIVPIEADRQRLNAQKLLSIKPDPRWPSNRAHPSVENLHGVRRLLSEAVVGAGSSRTSAEPCQLTHRLRAGGNARKMVHPLARTLRQNRPAG